MGGVAVNETNRGFDKESTVPDAWLYHGGMRIPVVVLGLGLFGAGCAAGPSTGAKLSRHEVETPLATAGARCQGGACTCREVDDYGRGDRSDESAIAPGHKRFEIRTGRGFDRVSVTVEGLGTLSKNTEQVDPSCGYVDLPPGRHRVHMHAVAAKREEGMVPALFINEFGARAKDWYQVFQFRCGGNQPCVKDDLPLWAEGEGKKPRGIFDPCGSTRIEDMHWQVEHSPEVRVEELSLELVLNVYKFEPRFEHGAPKCKGAGGIERDVPASTEP
jgi:hypothetical protein